MIGLSGKEPLRIILFYKKKLNYKLIKYLKNHESFLKDKMDVSKSQELS